MFEARSSPDWPKRRTPQTTEPSPTPSLGGPTTPNLDMAPARPSSSSTPAGSEASTFPTRALRPSLTLGSKTALPCPFSLGPTTFWRLAARLAPADPPSAPAESTSAAPPPPHPTPRSPSLWTTWPSPSPCHPLLLPEPRSEAWPPTRPTPAPSPSRSAPARSTLDPPGSMTFDPRRASRRSTQRFASVSGGLLTAQNNFAP